MTIFGVPWSELRLEHVRAFLEQADDEPLLWEAKGTELDKNDVRRQVCAFANGHEPGYLILGADQGAGEGWKLDGAQFPDEPRTWLTNLIGDPERGVRPRPDFDVLPWAADKGEVAVVRVNPTSTPPCMTNGTVYERLPGKTQTVRDPLRLADLFARGDRARTEAQARADRAARIVIEALQGDAGQFRGSQPDDETGWLWYAVGVAATGNAPDIASRLFKDEFAKEVWAQLADRPMPSGFRYRPDAPEWSQEALLWRHQVVETETAITVVRAAWDGTVAVGRKIDSEDVPLPDSLAEHQIATDWRLADHLMLCLGGFGDIYITIIVAGGRFPRRRDISGIWLRRGPLLPGVNDEHVASIRRELERSVGQSASEP